MLCVFDFIIPVGTVNDNKIEYFISKNSLKTTNIVMPNQMIERHATTYFPWNIENGMIKLDKNKKLSFS